MAYLSQEDVVPGQNVPEPGEGAVSTGGAGGAAATPKAAATPGQNVPAQPSAQLSAYLNANVPQAEAFAGKIAGDLGGKVSQAGGAINPAINAYTSNLYNVPVNAGVNQAVEQSPSGLTPEQKAAYQKQLQASSKSPNIANTFETTAPYQDLTQNIQKVVEQADIWGAGNNMPAIASALSPYEKMGQNSGNTTLDALLLSRTPSAYGKITNAVAPAKGLQGKLSAGTQTANDALKNAIETNTATTQAAKGSAGKFVNNLNSSLNEYLTKAQQDADAYNQSVNNLTNQRALVQPKFGSLQDAMNAYNQMVQSAQRGDAAQYFDSLQEMRPGAPLGVPSVVGTPSISQLGTQQNYSDIAALQELLGAGGLGALNPAITSDKANQAGTYSSPSGNIPTLQSLFRPVKDYTQTGLSGDYYDIFNGNLRNNQAVTEPYNAVLSAYNSLLQSIGQAPYTPGNVQPDVLIGTNSEGTKDIYRMPDGTTYEVFNGKGGGIRPLGNTGTSISEPETTQPPGVISSTPTTDTYKDSDGSTYTVINGKGGGYRPLGSPTAPVSEPVAVEQPVAPTPTTTQRRNRYLANI